MQRLDDAEFGRRQRERNLRANRQRRERMVSAGYCQWNLWIAGEVRQRAEQLAAQRNQSPSELIAELLSAAALPPSPPVDSPPLLDTAPAHVEAMRGPADERLARILALKREQPELSNYAIAAQIGCSEPTVRRALKKQTQEAV